jgi:RNA polymerase sigma-70 factor (ECF subfamily)
MRAFEPGSRPDDLRRLLENGTWVRRLAARLLWDESLTDDILQEVWITALERPPSKPAALRAWLRTVVRSLCLRANRALGRRKRIERGTERAAEVPSAEEVEDRLESQRRLLEAVLSLGEPYRSVIHLHFYEGLKLVEIARLRGISDSTVRTQLFRGLAELRERLARDLGGRGGMRTSLLALVLPAGLYFADGAAAAASALPTEGSARARPFSPSPSRARLLVAASAAAVLLAALVTLWSASRAHETGVLTAGAPSAVPAAAARVMPPVGGPDRETPRPERAVATIPAMPSIRVLVVDSVEGRPVEGARVYRAPRTDPGSHLLGRTAADGTLLVADPAALRDPWIVLAEGFIEHREPAARRDAERGVHVVRLEAELPAVVAVLDPDGLPAPGVPVTVLASVRGVHDIEPVTIATDLRGEVVYTFRHPDTTIRIASPGHVSLSLPAEMPRMTVRLRPGLRMEGIVHGPDGAPVSDCRVRIESGSLRNPVTVASDAGGVFSPGFLDPAEDVTLRFLAPGLPGYRATGRPPVDGPWRFQLPGGVTLSGTVSRPDGEPVRGGHAFILAPEGDGDEGPDGPASNVRAAGLPAGRRATRRLVTRARATIDDAGRFALGPVAQGGKEEYLFVLHPGHGRHLERLEVLEPGASVTVRLESGTKVTGLLTSPDGAPLAGVLLHFGETWSNDVECVIGRARTGADGRFVFHGLPDGVGQPLPGTWGIDRESVVRAGVFVAAFAPDVIVERAGTDGPAAAEVFPGAFDISDALRGEEPIRLIGAARERLASLAVCLRDGDGLPVRTWTRAAVLAAGGGVHVGVVGRNLHGARFFSDQTLAVERLDGADIVFLPEGYRWSALAGLDLREDGAIDVVLAPIAASPWRLRLKEVDGTPAAGRPALAGLPFGASEPRAAALLGRTDAEGEIPVVSLPPGPHAIAIPFDGSGACGELMRMEELSGRVEWSRVGVRDGGLEELTVPAR